MVVKETMDVEVEGRLRGVGRERADSLESSQVRRGTSLRGLILEGVLADA